MIPRPEVTGSIARAAMRLGRVTNAGRVWRPATAGDILVVPHGSALGSV